MTKKKKIDLGEEFKELTFEAFDVAKEKIEKGVKKLIKQGKISAQKGKALIDQQIKEWEKKRKEKLLNDLKELGIPTKKDLEQIKKELEEIKKRI